MAEFYTFVFVIMTLNHFLTFLLRLHFSSGLKKSRILNHGAEKATVFCLYFMLY